MKYTTLRDIRGKKTDIVRYEFTTSDGRYTSYDDVHIYDIKIDEIPLKDIDNSIKLYNYNYHISLEKIHEEYDFVNVIYKYNWKCTCGNLSYHHNIRYPEDLASEAVQCPHCDREINIIDNKTRG